MPKSSKMGRPVNGQPLVFFKLTLGLHPVRHAHIIARIAAAPKGKKSSVIVDMLENGVSSTPTPKNTEPTEEASPVKRFVDEDSI